MQNETAAVYQDLYGEHWEEGKRFEEEKLKRAQEEEKMLREGVRKSEDTRKERGKVNLGLF